MSWKDWPYWLKGAILFSVLHIVITLSVILWIILKYYVINPTQGTNYAGFGIMLLLILGSVVLIPAIIVGIIIGSIYRSYKVNPSLTKKIILIVLIVLFFSVYGLYLSRF